MAEAQNGQDDKILLEKWSPDVVIGFAENYKLFNSNIIPGTTTLYQWIDHGIMENEEYEYCRQIEPPVRSLEPVSAKQRANQCGRKGH